MAEPSRNGGASDLVSEVGIPTGLNRIKTRRVNANPGAEESDQYSETSSPTGGVSISEAHAKQKLKALNRGRVKSGRSKGFRKGRIIARWFMSSFFKDPSQPLGDLPWNKSTGLEFNKPNKEDSKRKLRKMQNNVSEDSPQSTSTYKVPKCVKSFSHELGPKGGTQSTHPRAHSYNDLKELLGSLRSRFDAAKEVVNIELGFFSKEMLEILQKADSLTPNEYEMAEELFAFAHKCIDMTSIDFRSKCETIVQDLTMKRQRCQVGLLKLLFTRILFILTRCTRLLHFEKDGWPINEQSLDKFRECLERIPSVDTKWVVNKGFTDSDTVYGLKQKDEAMLDLHRLDNRGSVTCANRSRSKGPDNEREIKLGENHLSMEQRYQGMLTDMVDGEKCHKIDELLQMEPINRKKENYYGDSNLVICRICEEPVPTIHVEPHSYICAFADKCVSKHLDVNERLVKLAELLEHLLELRISNNSETYVNPDILRIRTTNCDVTKENVSPKCTDWRSKGMDGMLEDLHEIDTACIEDSHIANLMNFKSHLLTKVNHYGSPSSNGSMASTSSANSPRSGNFDLFLIDQSNLSEQEDMQQINDLADIARCIAATDLAQEGSHEFLLSCMLDLQEILIHTKYKALLVDTFGGRIESLLREKYILACNQVDRADDVGHLGCTRFFVDSASQSSATSTPSHPVHKEGTSIDDFDIIKPISRGAYGKVFLARKRTTGDLFAVKVLKKLDMLRKNDIDRILAERNILITVRNPFVVRFFYSFTSTDNLYLVMEYLNGGDLFSLLKTVGCLEETIARTYIAELVLALEYLHSLGIVHRDLKPDNILIAHDGHIKLTDFGLSKIGLMNCTTELSTEEMEKGDDIDTHGQSNTCRVDSHQSAVGTPDYLAPEILLGTEHGYAADWWSVGIILFEFITGIPPFNADHPEIIFDNILNRKIPWPCIPSEMSYAAQDLIDRLLIHEPNQRLGAKGASEVKAHPFFAGVDWDNLTIQKAAFVPQPERVDDTSYFVSRYNSTGMEVDEGSTDLDSDSECSESQSSGVEKMDECGDLAEFDSSPLDLSLINFSFKNLSQLASINQDVVLQSGKETSKSSSPCKGSGPPTS